MSYVNREQLKKDLLLYAVKTATEAGFPVCSIYDTYSVGNAKKIQRLSNIDRKSTRLNSSHITRSRMPSSA